MSDHFVPLYERQHDREVRELCNKGPCATCVEPEPNPPATPLTRDCIPGQFVTWTNVLGWTFTGTLKEWDNGTAIIEWPMLQTPLIAV